MATIEQFVEFAGIDKLYIGDFPYITSAKKAATTSFGEAWGPHLLVFYAPGPGESKADRPSAMYQFKVRNSEGAYTFYEPDPQQTVVRYRVKIDQKVTGTAYGSFASNIITP